MITHDIDYRSSKKNEVDEDFYNQRDKVNCVEKDCAIDIHITRSKKFISKIQNITI